MKHLFVLTLFLGTVLNPKFSFSQNITIDSVYNFTITSQNPDTFYSCKNGVFSNQVKATVDVTFSGNTSTLIQANLTSGHPYMAYVTATNGQTYSLDTTGLLTCSHVSANNQFQIFYHDDSLNKTYTSKVYTLIALGSDEHITGSLNFCYGDSITLTHNTGNFISSSYWSYLGQTVSTQTSITCTANGVVGATYNPYSYQSVLPLYLSVTSTKTTDVCIIDSVLYTVKMPYSSQQICMVTVDTTTGHNEVIFEPTHGQDIALYKIYKQNNTTSNWDSIGVIHFDSLSTFIDYNSNPTQQRSSYAITVVDSTCGVESFLSWTTPHTTIHLSANLGTSGEANLSWNAYSGFSYNTFEIYRSNNGSAFFQIGNTANTVLSYTDLTPPIGTNRYYVAVAKQPSCTPSRDISSTISNILNPAETTTGISSLTNDNVSVYPNPFTDKLTVSPNVPFQLFDMIGREIYNSESTVNLAQIPVGVYVLKTANGSTRVTKNAQ